MDSNLFAPLHLGTLVRRYQRFFADIQTAEGLITAHCPNTGSMFSLLEPNQKAWYSLNNNPKRKLQSTLEFLQTPQGGIALVNTQKANPLVHQFLIAEAETTWGKAIQSIQAEVKINSQTRLDFKIQFADESVLWIEVKNVTLRLENGLAAFPDSVSLRGQKHLRELMELVDSGQNACLVFLISRTDCSGMDLLSPFDPEYSQLLLQARAKGVQILLLQLDIPTQQPQNSKAQRLTFYASNTDSPLGSTHP